MRDDHKINVVYKLIYIAELEKEKKGKKGTSLENRANIPHSYSKNLNTRTVLFWCFNLCIKLFQTIHFSWWNFSTNSLHFFSNFPMKSLQKKTETLFTKVNHFCWWLQWKCIHFSNDIVKKLIHFEFLIKSFITEKNAGIWHCLSYSMYVKTWKLEIRASQLWIKYLGQNAKSSRENE